MRGAERTAWRPGTPERRTVSAIEQACSAGTDLVCVLGGDGTFLRSASAIGETGVPALGINLGRIGFLAKVETDDLERALDQVVAGDYAIEERFRIEAAHPRAGRKRRRAPRLPERGGRGARAAACE